MGLGLASAGFCLVLRAWFGHMFGETYPYEALVLGVALGAAFGGAAGGLTAAVLMAALGGLVFDVWFGADPEGLEPLVRLAGLAVVVALIVVLRRMALEVRRERTTAERTLRQLEEAQEHGRLFVDLTPHIAWKADPGGKLTLLPKKMKTLTGAPADALMGEGWRNLVHPDDLPGVNEAWVQAVTTGGPYLVEFRAMRADGAYVWVRSQAYAARDGQGGITGWYGLTENIDARKEAERDRELLLREVDHRARNILAVLQGMVSLMPRNDPEAFADIFKARLAALAGAHTLLSESRWRGVEVRALLEEELRPFGLERVRLVGEALLICPERVQHLSMIFHELATNSAKYGSLSAPGGHLRVEWRRVDGGRVQVEWAESGGPPVIAPPVRRGFGSSLIQSIAGRRTGESLMQDWRPEGLCCAMVLADLIAEA